MKEPTTQQTKVLRFLQDYTTEHGYPPALREIGKHFGWTSTNAVNDHIRLLARKGLVSRGPHQRSRTTTITDAGKAWLADNPTPVKSSPAWPYGARI